MDATPPFVGRRLEIELLVDRLMSAGRGAGGVVLISGPAGIGKTRLLEEALRRYVAAAGPVAVGRGQCTDDRGAPPLWPWSRALRGVDGAGDLTAGLRIVSGRETIEGPATAAAARFATLTAATDAVLSAASDQPVVMLLEDLHWADTESLELLRRVAAEAASTQLLILATNRDAMPTDVAAAIADARRSHGVANVALGPLSEAEVGDYLRVVDPGGAANRALAVHRETGGLPLLLTTAADGDGVGTADLDVVVHGMLARLTDGERDIVEAMSILGGPAAPDVVAAAGDTDVSAVASAVTAGRRAGLLGAANDDGTPFVHALLQDAVRRSIDAASAATTHRRVAEVLSKRAARDPRLAGEAAAYWRRAGSDPPAARQAAALAEVAAEQAGRVLALDDAVRHLRDAVESLRVAGADEAETARVLVRLATAEFLAGDVTGALARCEEGAAAAERARRPDLIAAAAIVIRGVTNVTVSTVVQRLCRAALVADQSPSTRSRLLAQLASAAADAGRPDEATELAAEALKIAEADGNPVAVLDAVRAREMTLVTVGNIDERLRLGRLAISLAEPVGQPLAVVLGAGWVIRAGYELARLDIVDEGFAVMEEAATASGQPLAVWHLLRAHAARAAIEGRYRQANEYNLAARDISVSLGDLAAVGMAFAHAHGVAVARGDANDLLDNSIELLAHSPPIPLIRAAQAITFDLVGRRAEAFAMYEELRSELGSMVEDLRLAPTMLHLADLAVRFDDAATAEVLAARMVLWPNIPGSVGVTTAYFTGSPLRELGRLVALTGRLEDAESLLRKAIDRNLAVRARPFVALCRLDLADVLYRRGSLAEAGQLVRQAADDLRRLEMPGPLLRADRLAAAIATARNHADPLSPRERQVHDLVVHAKTNRQIADELVLSERTVESHVRSVLAKLGCANRTELLARAAAR